MAKLYVFGIGGTGSRVLRSLTMLLAAGVDVKGYDIVPIIIDPDLANADRDRNVKLLQKYIAIRRELAFTTESGNTFFKALITESVPNFVIPVQGTSNMTFERFIDFAIMGRENQAMAKVLFSDENLSSYMNVGFKGNPNIGSVVLNQISQTTEFADFANSFTQGDKIFIISSIFGGTGASGFPLLLNTLRQNGNIPNSGVINKAEIGAISVLPYFSLKQNANSAVDSTTFFSKTRAALRYYENNVTSANALYFIGDMQQPQYDNHDGGIQQENKTHLIEILAATAVIDFCKKNFANSPTTYLEIGLNNNGGTVTLQSFPPQMRDGIAYPLLEFALLAKCLLDDFSFVSSKKLKANTWLGIDIYQSEFVNNVRSFLEKFKDDWLGEAKQNNSSFNPFNMDSHLKDLVTGGKSKKKSFWSTVDKDSFRSELNDVHVQGSSPENAFMETYCIAAKKFAKENFLF